MSLNPGARLGHYDVTALIGEGGMGQVWQATDTQLDRQVALKILPDVFAADPDRLARFQREARVLASLNHPNIGQIHGIEEAEPSSGATGTGQGLAIVRALVLELVEGPTLADRIAEGPMPLDEAISIATQIAEALEAAHDQNVMHRDLKPANVKVKDDGTVKVLDFGLAKVSGPGASDSGLTTALTASATAVATEIGMVIGTAAYMAPEQARGKPIDKRADVWAFGAVLYEMLTGARPFRGDDASETMARVIDREPDWDALPDTVPPVLSRFLRRCLEKNPKKRVRDIGDVRLALEGAFETTAGAASEAPLSRTLPVWQRTVPLVLAGLVLAAISGVSVWTLTRPEPARVARFPIPLPADQSLGFETNAMVAISPDGSRVVYSANDSLWLRPVGELQAIQVPGTDGSTARGPFFSANGQAIAFWAHGQLSKVSLTGGTPVSLAAMVNAPFGATWSSDDMILYGQPEGIMRLSGTGGTPELLIPVGEGERFHGPQMLPGAEWVLFSVLPPGVVSWDAAQIVAQSATTGERTMLIDGGQDGRYLPTGHLVYLLDNALLAIPLDLGSRQVIGGAVRLVEGVSAAVGSDGGAAQFSVSAEGSLVYVPGSFGGTRDVGLTWVSRQGEEARVPAPPRAYGRPRVSPDGTRVAVDITDGRNRDIWIWDLAGETPRQLTFDEADDNYPLWTPDGVRVVFASSREGRGLFSKVADGTGQVERLKDGPARPYGWTADGRLLFEEAGDIGVLTIDGGRTMVEMLLNDAAVSEGEPAMSPDGRWLAYYSSETGSATVFVRPFPNLADGQWNVSVDYGVQPVWAVNGRELFFRNRGELMVARIETQPTFSSGTPTPVFSLRGYEAPLSPDDGRLWDPAPDGDRFLVRTEWAAAETTVAAPHDSLVLVENWFEELNARAPVP